MDPLILSNVINNFQGTQINLSTYKHFAPRFTLQVYELLIQQLEQLYQDNPNDKISSRKYRDFSFIFESKISNSKFTGRIEREIFKRNARRRHSVTRFVPSPNLICYLIAM